MTPPRDAEVIVVGAGVAGLVVAHDLARAGVRVVVLEASDTAGGLLRRGTLGGLDLDLGAESYATRTDAVPAFVADAALDLELTAPRPGGAHLAVHHAGHQSAHDAHPVATEEHDQREGGGHMQAHDEGQVRRLGLAHVEIARPRPADPGGHEHAVAEARHGEQLRDAL